MAQIISVFLEHAGKYGRDSHLFVNELLKMFPLFNKREGDEITPQPD